MYYPTGNPGAGTEERQGQERMISVLGQGNSPESPTCLGLSRPLSPDGLRGLSPAGGSWGSWTWSSEFHCQVFCSLAKAKSWAGSGLGSGPCILGFWTRSLLLPSSLPTQGICSEGESRPPGGRLESQQLLSKD